MNPLEEFLTGAHIIMDINTGQFEVIGVDVAKNDTTIIEHNPNERPFNHEASSESDEPNNSLAVVPKP